MFNSVVYNGAIIGAGAPRKEVVCRGGASVIAAGTVRLTVARRLRAAQIAEVNSVIRPLQYHAFKGDTVASAVPEAILRALVPKRFSAFETMTCASDCALTLRRYLQSAQPITVSGLINPTYHHLQWLGTEQPVAVATSASWLIFNGGASDERSVRVPRSLRAIRIASAGTSTGV